jgi:sugar fermentation stimulation protein A
VAVHACLLRCETDGTARLVKTRLPVDLSHGALAEADSGSYLVLLEIPGPCDVETGALGVLRYERGWYIYIGSARKNLRSRIQRHLRHVRKKRHWHIDYLSPQAKAITAYPIASYRNLECDLAGALEKMGGRGIPGFGSSDCRCDSHLFYFRENPVREAAFTELLLYFRHRAAFEKQP